MRLNKYLADCGVASRRKAEDIIKAGRVTINKKVVTDLATQVNEARDVVFVDGKKVVPNLNKVYFMFYKPKGCVTTTSDDRNRKTIYDFVGDIEQKVLPVVRLDYDSEGLLLLTNDGDLQHKLTHPSSEIPKTYIVKIEGNIVESDLAIIRKGAVVNGERYGSAKVTVLDKEEKTTRLEVIITEGKNREIRNMFAAVEKNVIFLKRVAIGDLRLGGLSRGKYRELRSEEVEYLKSL